MRILGALMSICALVPGCSEYKIGSDDDLPNTGGEGTDSLPRIVVEPPDINFGLVAEGDVVDVTVTIRNVGDATLHISDVLLDLNEGLTYDFALIEPFAWDLDPGIVSFVQVSITGAEDAVHLGRLRVDSDDADAPSEHVRLRHELPTDDGTPEEPPADDDPPTDDDPPSDDDPPVDDPPPDSVDDCEGDVLATFSGSEIYVFSWDRNTDSGILVVPETGWYHVYDTALSESGSDQFNETAYIRITNSMRPDGTPLYANCGDDWVVPDSDNFGSPPAGARIYVGTFWLEAGDNTLTMNHYCPLYRSGACPGFHFTDDPGGTCDSTNINSVHYGGYGICLKRVD